MAKDSIERRRKVPIGIEEEEKVKMWIVLAFCALALNTVNSQGTCPLNSQRGPCSAQLPCPVATQRCASITSTGDGVCCEERDVVAPPPTTSCVDKLNPSTGTSDCPFRANLCSNSVYNSLMRDQCPRTCGFCSGNTGNTATNTGTACVDKTNPSTGRSDCPNVAYLCNNAVYNQLMTEQCPATCGRCSGKK